MQISLMPSQPNHMRPQVPPAGCSSNKDRHFSGLLWICAAQLVMKLKHSNCSLSKMNFLWNAVLHLSTGPTFLAWGQPVGLFTHTRSSNEQLAWGLSLLSVTFSLLFCLLAIRKVACVDQWIVSPVHQRLFLRTPRLVVTTCTGTYTSWLLSPKKVDILGTIPTKKVCKCSSGANTKHRNVPSIKYFAWQRQVITCQSKICSSTFSA